MCIFCNANIRTVNDWQFHEMCYRSLLTINYIYSKSRVPLRFSTWMCLRTVAMWPAAWITHERTDDVDLFCVVRVRSSADSCKDNININHCSHSHYHFHTRYSTTPFLSPSPYSLSCPFLHSHTPSLTLQNYTGSFSPSFLHPSIRPSIKPPHHPSSLSSPPRQSLP